MTQTGRTPRGGFTLVEMLVVIAIIAILTSLITVAVFAALTTARDAANGLDMAQIQQGIETYANTNQSYPPSVAGNVDTAANAYQKTAALNFKRHMLKAYRNNTMNLDAMLTPTGTPVVLAEPFSSPTVRLIDLDPAEALPFFLGGGLRNSKTLPLSISTSATAAPLKIYEFNQSRLRDGDGDGLAEYLPPHTEEPTPYVYFESGIYPLNAAAASGALDYARWPAPSGSGTYDTAVIGVTRPWLNSQSNIGSGTYIWEAKDTYQLQCAGLDGKYGVDVSDPTDGNTYRFYSDVGLNWAGLPEVRDNQMSFSGNARVDKVLP